jgi:hypothetical protein
MASGDTIFSLPAAIFVGDNDAQLVAGDNFATFSFIKNRTVLAFDAGTDEEAATSLELPCPSHYSGGGLKAICHFFMASDATNDIELGIYVEAKTPGVDTPLNMNTTASFDSANTATMSLSTSTAGDPLKLEVTLTNRDSIAVGDLCRFGVRRNTQSANDDAAGDLYLAAIEIQEV